MNKEVEQLLSKCDNCRLKECIGCEFTWTDIQKIKKYVGNIEILNETYQVINELSEREIKKLEQKESILDKVTDKLKEDINNYNKELLKVSTMSIKNTDLTARILQSQKILNIIEGEKKWWRNY